MKRRDKLTKKEIQEIVKKKLNKIKSIKLKKVKCKKTTKKSVSILSFKNIKTKEEIINILSEEVDIPDSNEITVNYNDISKNKSRKKKGKDNFNSYGKVTSLVKIYKQTNKESDLLPILENLSGLVNSFTIILTPSHVTQQIFFNPYMKKFLYLFMTSDEKLNTTYDVYMQVVYRLRWTMRHYSYEDIYNMVLSMLIETIRKMKVIDGCDCIYYIQFIAKFQMQNFIINRSKDALSCIIDLPANSSHDDIDEDSNDDVDRLQYNYALVCRDEEDRLIERITRKIDITVLLREDQEYGYLTYYEKYILYMIEYLGYSIKEILSILKNETNEELNERIDDIYYKIKLSHEC